jgi:CelD/BcsL family acetyltransferase involved in cellulose biosynthesis
MIRDSTITEETQPLRHVRVVQPLAMTDEECRAWHTFRGQNRALDSPFFALSYARAVARNHPGAKVAIIRDDHQIVAFLPYHLRTKLHARVGHGKRLGGHLTDAWGLIAPSGFRISSRTLMRLCGLHYLPFSYLPQEQRMVGVEGGRLVAGLAIDLTMGSRQYRQQKTVTDTAFFRDLARCKRRLAARCGPLVLCFQQPSPEHHLDHLIDRKSEQYRRTNVYPALDPPWTSRLLHDLTRTGDGECVAVVSTLYAGETWVASHIGLRSESILHYWFPVYNVALKAFSPGHLMLDSMIDHAASNGVSRIDLGSGIQRAKRKFANISKSYYSGVWFQPGPRAIACKTIARLGIGMPS